MSNDQIIRAWKNKQLSVSLAEEGHTVPANPAGSAEVAMKDLEAGTFLTSPVSVCSIGTRCQCGA